MFAKSMNLGLVERLVTGNSPEPPQPSKRDQLEACLNRKARITVVDGRCFLGLFVCVDRDCNLVLSAAEEESNGKHRFVGTIIIKGQHIVKAEM